MIPVFPDFIMIDDSTITQITLDNVMRTQIEVGPQKTRPIACKPMFQLAFAVRICGLQDYNRYKFWFNTELSYGANWFLMIDPVDGIEKRFRFATTQLQWSKQNNIWNSNFALESMDA